MTLESIDLEQFIGSEICYRHRSGLLYTEGVQYLAEHGQAYWLIDAITSHQPQCMKDQILKSFQHWILKVNSDYSAQLICERDTNDIAFTISIPFTDFPLDTVKLYLVNRVLMLTSEY